MYQKKRTQAESVAPRHLELLGYSIVEQNWKVRSAEIDIVASKNNTKQWFRKAEVELYFFEVKYRKSLSQGDGFDYITYTKLKQMRYAADVYMAGVSAKIFGLHLGAIQVGGEDCNEIKLLEDVSQLLE